MIRTVDLGPFRLSLLPSAPYCVHGASPTDTVGIALERQRGVHAIASDRRVDFDTLPYTLAVTPAGMAVYSESDVGGEYLLLSLPTDARDKAAVTSTRCITTGSKPVVAAARQARRAMLAGSDATGLALVIEQLALLAQPAPTAAQRRALQIAPQILDLIEDHLALPSLTLAFLASQSQLRPLDFLRAFVARFGITPHQYVLERRIQRARRLLQHTRLPIAQIAADCGFAQQSHLGMHFRRAFGLTPDRYRQFWR
ncbi:helix-turn-helix domain-containing protein [Tahibacter amnicola]|uniref:AraC family transcriptional regulator n=1 Tax=Tahibacter amnicola TaxID=2976241 RepID=A0ABY6B9Z1_9GAMM|nr:AraC family transcriptional regulator [Tahibacter amnicola]UXI66367.1 AraC family transcriptional regulator [Tahibacter amnicola]